ncbi:PREDICTED: rho GDP-dissociation inhibitor 1-like [Priapulus caudatus]|uniref:Rho GDP-dissociation inhibitor 1-like n=1 Tax=Priapulus caudatus TaxID=37621 RepID=A0ABM1EHR3_PRICU|nr:PREDICTED: rho GDP-dissociation inhibitor 1-like [Priapulus caudatus]XP_014671735.1 PREDICTED: rho GDP-dissociation inhibitor 1-like [Priapulus caudatus]
MADDKHDTDLPEDDPNYRAPAEKALKEILETDKEDESLQKYKAALLGDGATGSAIIIDEKDPRKVIPKVLILKVDGRGDVELDLTGDLGKLKEKPFTIKEGVSYQMEIVFYVQREIVAGLKYVQGTYRKGIRVDKDSWMIGSYGPKKESQSYTTPADEAPSGMIARGSYTVKSTFIDDDKTEHLKWEWTFDIKKDWD